MSEQIAGFVPEFDLADRMRRALRSADLSGAEMAQALGVTTKSVSNWLNGKRAPNRATLVAWALATGVSLTWLETGQAPTDGPTPETGTPPGTRTLNPLIYTMRVAA